MKIYIDTSVLNGFFCQDPAIKLATADFFKRVQTKDYILYGSELVAEEIRETQDGKLRQALIDLLQKYEMKILSLSQEVKTLAQCYVDEKIIPKKYLADALHIATAAKHNVPVLVSWNFEHIVKHKTRIEVNCIHQTMDLPQIDICSPQEV